MKEIAIMKYTFLLLSFIISVSAFAKDKVLVFAKTAGFHHESIPVGFRAIRELGVKNDFDVDSTTDATQFNAGNLKNYKAVIFLNTTGNVLNEEQQQAFEKYIQAGGGFAGVHSATDTEYDWAWYGNLVGAYFGGHPAQQEAMVLVASSSIATAHLPKPWKRKDEWYNFKWLTKEKVNVLLTIDESSYNPGNTKMGAYHPMSWWHNYDGGRSFYTALGHTDESYSDPAYLQHLLAGIEYAMGRKKM